MPYRQYRHHITDKPVKRRTRKRGFGDIGADAGVMQRGLTASVSAVKSVGIVALIAAGGAIGTDYVFNMLADKKKPGYNILGLKIGDDTEQIAKAVFGIAGGLVIGKFLKKPQMGAAFAIGAVALAAYNLLNKTLNKNYVPAKLTAGLGYIQANRRRDFNPAPLALGAQRVQDYRAFQPMPAPAVGYGAY